MEAQIEHILDESVYKNIIQKNDIYTDINLKALKIVADYIIKNKRILTGGMAIDSALRKKGDHIYDEDTIPDYDFFSPVFHIDAYNIGNELVDAGLPNINVINAMHISTMRVRTNFITVADITYMPHNIYKNLPTLKYKKFRIIHPEYQYIDQHRSISLPYENPPWETILNRCEKDMKRYDLLYNKYELPVEIISKKDFGFSEYKLGTDELKNQCIGGFGALLYWVNEARKLGFKIDKMVPHLDGTIDEKKINIKIPKKSHGFTLFSDNLWDFLENLKFKKTDIKWYNALLDKLPRKIHISDMWEVFDNRGSLISAHKPWKTNIYFTNLSYIMVYSLTYYFIYKHIKPNDAYLYNFYISYILCRDIIMWASDKYIETPRDEYMKFLPTASVYGAHNWSESYLLYREQFNIQVGDAPKANILYKPKRAYPEVGKKTDVSLYKFDPKKSPIYQFDGKPTEIFYPTNPAT